MSSTIASTPDAVSFFGKHSQRRFEERGCYFPHMTAQHIFSMQLRDATVDLSHGTYWILFFAKGHEVQIGSTDDRFDIRNAEKTPLRFRAIAASAQARSSDSGVLLREGSQNRISFLLSLPVASTDPDIWLKRQSMVWCTTSQCSAIRNTHGRVLFRAEQRVV